LKSSETSGLAAFSEQTESGEGAKNDRNKRDRPAQSSSRRAFLIGLWCLRACEDL
jgi:hypothetical protein